MLVEAVLSLAGLVALVAGATRAVTAAEDLVLYYWVSPFFVGVTLLSVGTSVPELFTSVCASYYGAGGLVVGNIVGSETTQITIAVAVVAVVAPFVSERRDIPVYGTAILLSILSCCSRSTTASSDASNFQVGMLLGVPYAASLGGVGSLIARRRTPSSSAPARPNATTCSAPPRCLRAPSYSSRRPSRTCAAGSSVRRP